MSETVRGDVTIDPFEQYTLSFDARHLRNRSFLLGSRNGFVLHLPAEMNVQDRTLLPGKWYGASGFGRSFLEGFVIQLEHDGKLVALNRTNQTAFLARLDGASRIFRVDEREIREHFFVPNNLQAVVLTLECDLPFVVTPEFDMRYYQELNTDFSQYRADLTENGLVVFNHVDNAGALHASMDFYSLVAIQGAAHIEMLPENQRLVKKTYLKDEKRQKLIRGVYGEGGSTWSDEAPLWDRNTTEVYAPARFRSEGTMTLLCAFGDTLAEVQDYVTEMQEHLPRLQNEKRARIREGLDGGLLQSGNRDVDTAYAHVLTRFNDALVARDTFLHVDPIHRGHFYGIFAGDKYFMDVWKRDENISLGALIATNDFETMRHILDATWQSQDVRTGRLPQIIRVGEPLVYYSSDGTLWALHRLMEYTRVSGDETLLLEKMPMVETFFSASMSFVHRGLLPSGGIIEPDYLWETWEDTPFTPRAGYPVEIELLWLTVLASWAPWVEAHNRDLANRMERALEEGTRTFQEFEHEGYLVDSLSYDWQPHQILTPNGYTAFALGFPLPPELQRSMVQLAREQLAGRRGVRSLAPRDWATVFPAAFLADPHSHRGRDMGSVGIYNYHRGIEWGWFNPFFVIGELHHGSVEDAFGRYVQGQITGALHEAGIGGLSELHDMNGELGADYQAWSMAGLLQSLHLFAGVHVDALQKVVRISPTLPPQLPYIRSRHRVGNTRFDLAYEQPSPGNHRLRLDLLDPISSDHTVHVGIRVPVNSRILTATYNGRELAADAWRYEGRSDTATSDAVLWTTLPLQSDLDLGITLAP